MIDSIIYFVTIISSGILNVIKCTPVLQFGVKQLCIFWLQRRLKWSLHT